MVFTAGVLESLCDEDLINFLLKVRSLLKPSGKYMMREYLSQSKDKYEIWQDTNQIARPMKTFLFLLELTGLRPVRIELESHQLKNGSITILNVILETDE
jgi:hypothetical protein